MATVKNYRPSSNSLSTGQVLHRPYKYEEAKLIIKEMADNLVLDMVTKKLVTDQIVIAVGYDTENFSDPNKLAEYRGEVVIDHYGRLMPKYAHGSINLDRKTSSSQRIMTAAVVLFERITDPKLLVRRINIIASRVWDERVLSETLSYEQLDMFTNYDEEFAKRKMEDQQLSRERRRQEAVLHIRRKYGRNAILRGMNLEEGATAMDRNKQVGGHRA